MADLILLFVLVIMVAGLFVLVASLLVPFAYAVLILLEIPQNPDLVEWRYIHLAIMVPILIASIFLVWIF